MREGSDVFLRPDSYEKHGFRIVRNVLSAGEVAEARRLLDGLFKKGPYANQRVCCVEEVFKHPLLTGAIFRKTVVDALKEGLGEDLSFIPDYQVLHNGFGIPGWHVDCGSETGNAYLNGPDYKFAKCGIFLQDHSNGWGGGLYVKPGTHKAFLAGSAAARKVLKAVDLLKIKLNLGTLTAPVNAGDFMFFDARLLHQSAEPSPENRPFFKEIVPGLYETPLEHTKYILYWDACRSDMVEDHLKNCVKRAGFEKPDPGRRVGGEVLFNRHLGFFYPDDYPAEAVRRAEALGVRLASLDREAAGRFKARFQALTAPSRT